MTVVQMSKQAQYQIQTMKMASGTGSRRGVSVKQSELKMCLGQKSALKCPCGWSEGSVNSCLFPLCFGWEKLNDFWSENNKADSPKAPENADATITTRLKNPKNKKQATWFKKVNRRGADDGLVEERKGKTAVGKKQKQNLVVQMGVLHVVKLRQAYFTALL